MTVRIIDLINGSEVLGLRALRSEVSGLFVALATPVQVCAETTDLVGLDSTWTDLDCSAAVPAGAVAATILLAHHDATNGAAAYVALRQKGVTSGGTAYGDDGTVVRSHAGISSAQPVFLAGVVPVNVSRMAEYKPVGYSATGDLHIRVTGYYAGPLA